MLSAGILGGSVCHVWVCVNDTAAGAVSSVRLERGVAWCGAARRGDTGLITGVGSHHTGKVRYFIRLLSQTGNNHKTVATVGRTLLTFVGFVL